MAGFQRAHQGFTVDLVSLRPSAPPRRRDRGRVDDVAFENGLITYSTMPTRDGFAGDQTLFAPPFTSTDAELAEMVDRYAASVRQVAKEVETKLEASPA